MTRPDAIRVFLADDHPFVRRGVRETLEERGVVVVAEASSGEEALAWLRSQECGVDVLVTDISMPGIGGLELVSRLAAERPGLPVLVLSTHPARELGLHVLEAGGAGYVEKREAPKLLTEAVKRVAGGNRYIGPELGELLAKRALGLASGSSEASELSLRETQVVRAIAGGKTRAEICKALALSASAVSTYRRRALDKLQLATDADLALYASSRGMVENVADG